MAGKKSDFAEALIESYRNLPVPQVPPGITILNPYQNTKALEWVKAYYCRFYTGSQARIFIFGINPGRLGAGLTGIPFTDPVQLSALGISNDLHQRPELSSAFIYDTIKSYGGLSEFAKSFTLSAVCPLGFVKDGKNYNYYDDRQLEISLRPYIINWINEQIKAGADRRLAVCLGEGANFRYLNQLNLEHSWFHKVESLPHPRYIMQYKRADMKKWIRAYVSLFKKGKEKAKIS
jgi:hypothetical protein